MFLSFVFLKVYEVFKLMLPTALGICGEWGEGGDGGAGEGGEDEGCYWWLAAVSVSSK